MITIMPEEIFADLPLMAREGLDVPETTRVLHELGLPKTAMDPESCAAIIAAAKS